MRTWVKGIIGGGFLGLCGWALVAQSASVETLPVEMTLSPSQPVKQGQILRVRGWVSPPPKLTDDARSGWSARMYGQTAKLFWVKPTAQSLPSGDVEALLGVSVDTPVGPTVVEILSPKGEVVQKIPATISDGRFRKQNISVSKQTAGLQPIAGEIEAITALKNTLSDTRWWQTPLKSPTPDCENSPFGVKRYHNGVYIHDYHKGVDLRSPAGRPIKAITGGKVVIGTSKFRLHGGTVGLDHGQGLTSIYIHMSKVLVKPGQQVEAGQPIGLVGSTGFASGPHLHWGLYVNGVPVNPDVWISVPHCGKG